MNMEIKAGYVQEKLVEIRYPNSILYIAFNTVGLNINFHLVKFCPTLGGENIDIEKLEYEQQKYFYEIFKIEKIEGSKIVLFVKNPGIYKIIFDNKYSWFNSKLIRYRLSVLRENLDKNGNNKENKIDIDKNINNNEINNINNNDVINDNKDETEKMDKEKNSEIIVLQK